MSFLSPAPQSQRRSIEVELEAQKTRLKENARRASRAIRNDLDVRQWMRDYPLESALIFVFGGIVLSQFSPTRRSKQRASASAKPDNSIGSWYR